MLQGLSQILTDLWDCAELIIFRLLITVKFSLILLEIKTNLMPKPQSLVCVFFHPQISKDLNHLVLFVTDRKKSTKGFSLV